MERTGSKLTKMPDAELIGLALKKHEGAYLKLYERYKTGVTKHLSEILKRQDDVEDICIESFEKAFRKLELYDPQYQFSTWLYTIATNTARDHLNKSKRIKNNIPTKSIDMEDESEFQQIERVPADIKNPEEDIIDQQEYDKFINNIEKLKDEYREIAKLRLIDNLAYQEIAERLEMPLNTVKTRISRARALLTKMMDLSDELL